MTDLVQKLVGALEECLDDSRQALADMEQIYSDSYRPWRLVSQRKTIAEAEAALTAAKAGGWVAVQGEPVAWMRKWAYEGEEPQKIRNENGRMAWPAKFKFLPVTQGKCMSDDVPLYAPLPNPPKGEV